MVDKKGSCHAYRELKDVLFSAYAKNQNVVEHQFAIRPYFPLKGAASNGWIGPGNGIMTFNIQTKTVNLKTRVYYTATLKPDAFDFETHDAPDAPISVFIRNAIVTGADKVFKDCGWSTDFLVRGSTTGHVDF
ncbi:MAG: hypothetical protein JKX97_00840 [Candidatus Lindowbacteria bacterium]|nr:hypothetical protein [Candidatus Lindowbacteria bacterium]